MDCKIEKREKAKRSSKEGHFDKIKLTVTSAFFKTTLIALSDQGVSLISASSIVGERMMAQCLVVPD